MSRSSNPPLLVIVLITLCNECRLGNYLLNNFLYSPVTSSVLDPHIPLQRNILKRTPYIVFDRVNFFDILSVL
jgi:hypothetical protein